MVDSTAKRIETAIGSEQEGKIVFSTDYAELGTPEAIKKSLIRLCERNVIVRLAHGIYYKPKYDKEIGLGMLEYHRGLSDPTRSHQTDKSCLPWQLVVHITLEVS